MVRTQLPPDTATAADVASAQASLARALEEARAEIARLTAEYEDLNMLYEATIEHGEAVEDELAEKNILLQATQSRLQAELSEAAGYVHSIVPPPRTVTPRTDWLLVPSTELGGDSFGYHDIDADHFAIYLLDVCGHGVGAALLSASVINVLRAAALQNTEFREPASVLKGLNAAFPMENQNNMFFTIWYGVYRRSDATLRYSSGGHPPAIHLRGRDPATASELITWGGAAIGTFPDVDYESATMPIEPGDRLLVLSDGVFEISRPDGSMIDFSDLVQFVATPEQEVPDAIFDWVRSLNGPGSLPDDFSLLRVQF